MAKVKFPLELANGVQVRTLKEFIDNYDSEKIIGYFLDGKLKTWLADRYYEDEAEKVSEIRDNDDELGRKLCEIFGVDYIAESHVDTEVIKRRNERITKLKQYTDDVDIITNINLVAFNQEELGELFDSGVNMIYLCEGEFNIPKSKLDIEYIELGNPIVIGKSKVIWLQVMSSIEQYSS